MTLCTALVRAEIESELRLHGDLHNLRWSALRVTSRTHFAPSSGLTACGTSALVHCEALPERIYLRNAQPAQHLEKRSCQLFYYCVHMALPNDTAIQTRCLRSYVSFYVRCSVPGSGPGSCSMAPTGIEDFPLHHLFGAFPVSTQRSPIRQVRVLR